MNKTTTALCLILVGILIAIALAGFAPKHGGESSHPKGLQIPTLAHIHV